QRERALELLAAQKDAELTLREPRAHQTLRVGTIVEPVVVVLVRRIRTAVPDDDFARTVLLGWNHTLERRIVERMVLDVNRHALVDGIERRPLRHRPGYEHAVQLDAEIPMHLACGVLLNNEQQRAVAAALGRRRLRCLLEGALGRVFFQRPWWRCGL